VKRLKLLSEVCDVLDHAGVSHALIGASALAVHGVARSTLDVDLLVITPAVSRVEAWQKLRDTGAVVEVRLGDFDDPLSAVVRIERDENYPVDVIVGKYAWQAEVIDRAVPCAFAGLDLRVAQVADLVLLKLFAGGPADRLDIIRLLLVAPDTGALNDDVRSRLSVLDDDAGRLWKRLCEEAAEG